MDVPGEEGSTAVVRPLVQTWNLDLDLERGRRAASGKMEAESLCVRRRWPQHEPVTHIGIF